VFTTDPRAHDPENHRKMIQILSKYNPVGLSAREIGKDKTIRYRYVKGWNKLKDSGIFESSKMEDILKKEKISWGSAVYTSYEDVKNVIKGLKKADLGISVVVTGILDHVHKACKCSGLEPHTVNLSAGTFGNLELLPEDKILEITTMCGHHMISPFLVKYLIEEIKKERLTYEEASVELAKQCTCNFFNVDRGIKLMKEYIEKN
jgi:hypothetical protein